MRRPICLLHCYLVWNSHLTNARWATMSRRTSLVCLRRVNRTIVPVTSAMRSRGRSTKAFDTDASSRRRIDDDHAHCVVGTAGHRGGDRLLDACAGDDLGCAWHDPGPQAGAFRSLPRGGDDLPGGAVRGPGGAVPV